jgi:hypothetical protein
LTLSKVCIHFFKSSKRSRVISEIFSINYYLFSKLKLWKIINLTQQRVEDTIKWLFPFSVWGNVNLTSGEQNKKKKKKSILYNSLGILSTRFVQVWTIVFKLNGLENLIHHNPIFCILSLDYNSNRSEYLKCAKK